MKFFEIYSPYYALIKAKSVNEAINLYVEGVADDDGTLKDEIKEVDRDYALARYSRGKSEDGKLIPLEEVLEDFSNDDSMVLLIDPALA
jgi:hypothetical protein